MADTTIGFAVLQIIPSLRGVTEVIDKEIAGHVVPVTIEPQTDPAKVDQSVKDAVKKSKPPEIELQPKVDKSKVDEAVKDSVKKGKPPEVKIEPKLDPVKTKGVADELQEIIVDGLESAGYSVDEIFDNAAKRIGSKIGGVIGDSSVGHWIQDVAANVQDFRDDYITPAVDAVHDLVSGFDSLREHDAAGTIGGVSDALRDVGQSGAADFMDKLGGKVGDTQTKFGQLRDNISGTTKTALELTNNSGKIAGGLSTIANAAGPLAGTFAALTTLMPGFNDSLNNVLAQIQGKQGFNFNDWLHTAFPQLGILDRIPGIKPPGGGSDNPLPPARIGENPPLPGGPITQPGYDSKPGSLNPFDALNPVGTPSTPAPAPSNLPKSIWEWDVPDHAGGGMISGPGTGISDSILGWPAMVRVSNKEFVTNAADTEKNLPLLEAVNSGAPLWEWMKSMPRFGTGGLVAGSAQLRKIISERFGITDIGGYRPADKYGEHSTGRALDVMTGNDKAKGDAVKDFALANAAAIDLKWVIWRQHLYYPGGGGYDMPDRGSPTQNHMDHVHIFSGTGIVNGLLGNLAGGQAAPTSMSPGDGAPATASGAAPTAGTTPAPGATGTGGSSGGSFGGFSIPGSLTDIGSFGLGSLGQGVGATQSGSDLSVFGQAAGAAVSGQVSSALDVFGVPGAPGWLQGISKFVGGISVGSGGGGATPAAASLPDVAAPALGAAPDSVSAGQQPGGPQTNYYIQTARVEDAFLQAKRIADAKALAKLDSKG